MSFPETSHLWRENVGRVTCPLLGLCCHGDANSCARSLSMSVPRSLMMVISGAAFRLSREQKMAFQRNSVCNFREKANNLWISNTKIEKVMWDAFIIMASARALLCSPGGKRPEVWKGSGTGNLIISTRPKANFSPTLLKSYGDNFIYNRGLPSKWRQNRGCSVNIVTIYVMRKK